MEPLTGVALFNKLMTVGFIGTGPDEQAPTPGESICSNYMSPQRQHMFVGDNPRSFLRSLAFEGLLVDHRVHFFVPQQINAIFSRLRDLTEEELAVYDENNVDTEFQENCNKRLFILMHAIADTGMLD